MSNSIRHSEPPRIHSRQATRFYGRRRRVALTSDTNVMRGRAFEGGTGDGSRRRAVGSSRWKHSAILRLTIHGGLYYQRRLGSGPGEVASAGGRGRLRRVTIGELAIFTVEVQKSCIRIQLGPRPNPARRWLLISRWRGWTLRRASHIRRRSQGHPGAGQIQEAPSHLPPDSVPRQTQSSLGHLRNRHRESENRPAFPW